MSETSALYRLAPPSDAVTAEERERRMKAALYRLTERYGREAVRIKITEAQVSHKDEPIKAHLLTYFR